MSVGPVDLEAERDRENRPSSVKAVFSIKRS